MASIQNFLIREYIKYSTKKKHKGTLTVESTRNRLTKLTDLSPLPKKVSFEKINCNGVEAEWAIPENLKNPGAVLFLHGGAYVAGSIETHRALVGRLAIASKTKCLSVEYGLAPEKPFPNGLDDAIKVYHWLLQNGFENDKIVISGDSAGGGLAVAALVRLRDENAPRPSAGVVMSPWLDLLCSGESGITMAKHDPMLKTETGQFYALQYTTENMLTHPHVSPLYSDPTGLPPMYIQVSGSEVLLDDTLRFEVKAKAVGVEIEVETWDKMIHVWQAFSPYLPEATRAVKRLGIYIEKKTK